MGTPRSTSRRQFLIRGAAGAASLAAAGVSSSLWAGMASVAAQTPDFPATVSATPSQTMQGFGASGAWWPNDLVHFRPEVQQTVADMLFGQEGIALSVYRFNIGGGGVGVSHPGHATETFLVSPGAYDWDRDPGGRLFLRLAAERGVPVLIGFVNSAPAVWTTNGESRGGELQPEAIPAFAEYLADIVVHFRDAEGISLSYVSPMNEPNYTFGDGFQEGMAVPVEHRAALVQALGRQLAARAPSCRVIADESSRVGEHFMRDVPRWLSVPGTSEHVAALALHRYDFANELPLRLAREFAEDRGKALWSTEICCIDSRTGTWGAQYDPTIKNALMMAHMIWQGLTVANDAAFHWWLACSSVMGTDPASDPEAAFRSNGEGWNDGLLYYDPGYAENGNQRIYPTKRYYALGNFSRYVRPGDRRHDVTGAPRDLQILAFARGAADAPAAAPVQLPGGGGADRDWTIVVINQARAGSDAATFRIQLPVRGAGRLAARVAVETSSERSLDPVELPSVSASGVVSARVPAQSITTYVIGGTGAR